MKGMEEERDLSWGKGVRGGHTWQGAAPFEGSFKNPGGSEIKFAFSVPQTSLPLAGVP
jgi:hypothetical protein